MRKFFWALLISSWAVKLSAQDSTSTLPDPDGKTRSAFTPLLYNYNSSSLNSVFNEEMRDGANFRLAVVGDYAFNSKAIAASLGYGLIFKNDIPRSLVDRIDNRIKDVVKFEDQLKTGATFSAYLRKWDGTIFGSYHHRQMRYLIAPKEAFQTVFYGNARFGGDSADFSNLQFYNYIYNQYSAGIKRRLDYGKYQMELGVSLSFTQMINHQEIRTKNASIYTAEDGDTIRINYDLTFNSANEGATNFGDLNGIGGSGDFHLAFMNKNKWRLSVDVSDMGYVYFRKNPVNYSAAKTVEFTGFIIPDLLSFSSETFDTLNIDSTVKSYLPTKTANEYSLFMPFSVSFVFSKPLLHDKLVLSAGLQYRYIPNYKVYGYLKANYFIKPDMVFSVSAGAGGYSLFNLGVEFSKSWKYFDFALGTGNLIGLVAPSHYTGTGLYLRIGTSF
jgi:hypothetical protein